MMKRRGFLWGIAAIGGAALVGWRALHATREEAILTIVRKRLSYLRLDDDGLHAFARDYVAAADMSSSKLRLIAALAPVYERLPTEPNHAIGRATRFGEERVATRYLLSTDFFINGSDESRVVRYTGYFDPMRACGNPFARPVIQPSADSAAGST